MSLDDARVVGFARMNYDGTAVGDICALNDMQSVEMWAYETRPVVFESLLAEAESRERKAVQQLKETNRQLSCGVSIGGRQFYGTPDDIAWLTEKMKQRDALQSRLDAVVLEVKDTVRRLENRVGRQKAGGLPANSEILQGFANELKTALRSAALGGESHGNDEVRL